MGKKIEQFRKRHQKRKAERIRRARAHPVSPIYANMKEIDQGKKPLHPLFSKELFLIKVFLSIVLFLSVAILFKQPDDKFTNLRQFVEHTFEQDFKFAAVAAWYERQFGKPLALLPERLIRDDSDTSNQANSQYAVPVTGKVIEPFDVEKKGIMLETEIDEKIECIQDGFVVFVGEREGLNKTVIVQHHDGSESWYGNLESVDVALYDYIKSGQTIGMALKENDEKTRMFFFALKQGESFIDPIQVMSFD